MKRMHWGAVVSSNQPQPPQPQPKIGSGYKLFAGDRLKDIRKTNQDIKFGEMAKKVAHEWHQLDEKIKNEYNAIADCMMMAMRQELENEERQQLWHEQLSKLKQILPISQKK
jgi:hypothetical protein